LQFRDFSQSLMSMTYPTCRQQFRAASQAGWNKFVVFSYPTRLPKGVIHSWPDSTRVYENS